MTTYSPTTGATATATPEAARPLRMFLTLDAVVTGGNGLIYLALSGPVGELLGLNSGFLVGIGVFLLAYGVFVGALAARPVPPVTGTKLVIDANALWAVASIAALLLWLEPSAVGTFWIPAQALVVGAFAALQHVSLKKMREAGGR
ncbi:hypothetical protein GL263_13020 [Streptomyces durbertensis]|uniref:Integral membrane protein n=1 Tax=Streptomyces durbertensis TaxID=2448886 RepID=A0ABR6EGN3_9ACTN|nr:hypothetical protein [Streptomyces durbertensis]MBB1244477.1 hypothetical protein [Streptomyces durbertensis]